MYVVAGLTDLEPDVGTTATYTIAMKPPVEAQDSWEGHVQRQDHQHRREHHRRRMRSLVSPSLSLSSWWWSSPSPSSSSSSSPPPLSSSSSAYWNEQSSFRRRLHHHHHGEGKNHDDKNNDKDDTDKDDQDKNANEESEREWVERQREKEEQMETEAKAKEEKLNKKRRKKNKKLREEMLESSGVRGDTVHGMMIDAGSTGSRMHVYEFKPRILVDDRDVEAAVSGRKLSYPGTDTRWTERLSPGLGTFASLPDDELIPAVADYLDPLIEFAKDVLHTKQQSFPAFPIYLKATAGLRVLDPTDRSRVIGAVRTLFANKTYCPFSYEDERVRVISGEEEAIYGWAGVNWLMGTLMKNSEGFGSVVNPRLTYGALDLGGASTQISFYEPGGDIMSNLFKLQIGQGKHWNVYAHSFLKYGMNAAQERVGARLASDKSVKERLVEGVYDPCLPGGSRRDFKSNIRFGPGGIETTTDANGGPLEYYSATFINDGPGGDWDACSELARSMLHKEANSWCDFSHGGDCSFAGVYQPRLPLQSTSFGEFLGFSNYNHIWQFLQLPPRSSVSDLQDRARTVCSMSREELLAYNNATIDESIVEQYCFHSAYAFNLLHYGYGFPLDYHITSTNVVNGQKVDWALGAMLYEINTLPWTYAGKHGIALSLYSAGGFRGSAHTIEFFVGACFMMMVVLLAWIFNMQSTRRWSTAPEGGIFRGRDRRRQYEPLKEIEMEY